MFVLLSCPRWGFLRAAPQQAAAMRLPLRRSFTLSRCQINGRDQVIYLRLALHREKRHKPVINDDIDPVAYFL